MTCCIPERFVVVLMAHFSFFIVYALRVNLSVALVAMVNSTYSDNQIDPECPNMGENQTVSENNGEFNWNQNQQGVVLASFFYGYLVTQIPGGWAANKYGGKHVLGIGVLASSILAMLTPVAARQSIFGLIVVRALAGFFEGVTIPTVHAIMAQWVPPQEISRMGVWIYAGTQTGTTFALCISGIMASSTIVGGWPSSFYLLGSLGVLWYVLWMFVFYDRPEIHPRITTRERDFILKQLDDKSSNTLKASTPWLKIFTSLPVWAITVAHFSYCWVLWMVLTGLPLYFQQVLNIDLKSNGLLSALPFISGFVMFLVIGNIADYLRKNHISTQTSRRLAAILGFYPTAVFLILASYAGCGQKALSVVYMVLVMVFLFVNNVGFMVNHLDISPRFSGILMGISNFAGTVAGCISPSVTGYFTNDNPSREEYRKVFIVAAVVCFLGGTFNSVFLSGVVQPWNDDEASSKFQIKQEDEVVDESTPLIRNEVL